jgi:hypothetical protein
MQTMGLALKQQISLVKNRSSTMYGCRGQQEERFRDIYCDARPKIRNIGVGARSPISF